MIFKSDIIDAINSLSHDLTALALQVSDLKKEVNDIKSKKVKVKIKSSTKKKAPHSNTQPRDKSGKFIKK